MRLDVKAVRVTVRGIRPITWRAGLSGNTNHALSAAEPEHGGEGSALDGIDVRSCLGEMVRLEATGAAQRLTISVAVATVVFSCAAVASADWQDTQSAQKNPSPPRPMLREHPVELFPPPDPGPPRSPEPVPNSPTTSVPTAKHATPSDRSRAPAPRRIPVTTEAPTDHVRHPQPAQAGVVLTADADSELLDFTSFDIVVGNHANRYAGGVTASAAANNRAIQSPIVDLNAAPGQVSPVDAIDFSRPVGLRGRRWDCP